MRGISTTISLIDQMTAPIMAIQHAISGLENRFNAVESAANIDTSSLTAMQNQVDMADAAARVLADNMQLVEDNIRNMTQGQSSFNNEMSRSASSAGGLVQKIGAAVAAYASIQGVKTVLSLSDDVTNTTARLNLMNDGLQTTQQLQDKIFLAAQRSHGEYLGMSQTVSKLGLLANDAFSGNDEIIAFAEQMNKQFIIGGSSIQEQKNAMYQLTQAMAAGKLQGDEFRSITENAPMLADSISSYMENAGVSGTMKDWAADGLLTAEVIKAALFSVTDETNAKFEEMPMTFGQIAVNLKNQALMQFQPILNRLNDIANSQGFQILANNAVNAFVILSGVAAETFNIIATGGQFMSDNWSMIAPVIYGVAAALLIYNGYLLTSNIITGISNGLAALSAARSALKAGATLAEAAATTTATGAQVGLNAALLACPITWIIIAIIALIAIIYLGVAAVNKFAGTSYSATGIIFGAFAWLGSVIANIFLGMLELVFLIINAMVNPFIQLANFIANIFTNPISSIIYAFQGMGDGILAILQKIAGALDFVFGSNMADAVAGWRSGLKDMADAAVAKHAPNENYQKVIDELDLSVEKTLDWKRFDNTDAYRAGYTAGENLENTVANFDLASLFPNNIPSASDYGNGAFDYSGLENGVNNIDANTSKQLDYSEEELKLWRDIAERDTINRFTTAEVYVEFGDINNNVSSDMDLDGIADYIGDSIEETLYEVAEGVHV